ncbi:MAG: hypothetical protein RLZZ579_1035, partial [Actinomycetota bacterium]
MKEMSFTSEIHSYGGLLGGGNN